jgi:hypothetical protein
MHKFYIQKHFIRFEIFLFCWKLIRETGTGQQVAQLHDMYDDDGTLIRKRHNEELQILCCPPEILRVIK